MAATTLHETEDQQVPAAALSPSAMLAISMHAQPGVYALLLGSGVSTGAGVPTGWGVVKELVRRVAAASAADDAGEAARLAETDPEGWWAKNGTGDLGYSTLLASLAPTPSARQGLLAEFFEATDKEREEGIKVPSRSHHAVAQLVKRGFVRVILTTNFDRLTEQALEAAGVAPQVVARPEAVHGMAPLAHASATLIKLHGDYKDLGTRNTPEELGEYPEEWTTLLHRVFDDYGLVIAGWSADWDTALVAALDGSPNRRYPLYWDSRSSKGESAQRLLTARTGQVIPATGADEMFGDILASVEALDVLAQPPLATAMAIARLKRYLPDPRHRIDLHDLVFDFANDIADDIAGQVLSAPSLDGSQIQGIWERHLEAAAPLTNLLVTGIWHDPDGTQDRLWVDVLQRLVDAGTTPLSSVTSGLDDARLWPALIAMTAAGVAAVRRGHERIIMRLATQVQGRGRMGTGDPQPAAQLLHPDRLLTDNWVNAMPRWAGQHWLYPPSHLLKADLRRFFQDLIPNEDDYRGVFHGYEYRLGLLQERQKGVPGGYGALRGEYVGERGWDHNDIPFAEVAFRQAAGRDTAWPWEEFLGTTDLDRVLADHREVLKRYKRWG
jgi:hypothetical protein